MCVELSESKMRDHFCLGLVNFSLCAGSFHTHFPTCVTHALT